MMRYLTVKNMQLSEADVYFTNRLMYLGQGT